MIARKCDRCGSFYIPNYSTIMYTINKKTLFDVQIDLCPKCHDDLIKFMTKPNMVHECFEHKEKGTK